MLKTRLIVLMLIVLCGSAYGADTKPSDQSIRELMRVTESRKLLDNVMGQVDALMKSNMQQTLKGETIAPEEQKQIDDIHNNLIAMFRKELSWDKLEPLYLKIYKDTFTQQEVDGMLAFYKSPTGQAVVHKMPLVIRGTTAELQKQMLPHLRDLIRKESQAIERMKAGAAQK